MSRKNRSSGCELDMTPMIDVVFQLIIFFIVTIQLQKELNEDIILEMGRYGPEVEKEEGMVIEVDQRGWISIHGAQLTKATLTKVIKNRRNRYGDFPVMIRGDYRAQHSDIRGVMDICTGVGLWRINFIAVKEKKT